MTKSVAFADFAGPGYNVTIPITPGATVPDGDQLEIQATGADIIVTASGYTVPAAAAPSSSAILKSNHLVVRRAGR